MFHQRRRFFTSAVKKKEIEKKAETKGKPKWKRRESCAACSGFLLRVECTSPLCLPSPRSINGLFLRVASVEPHTALTHYSQCDHPKPARPNTGVRGAARGPRAPEQKCWAVRLRHFRVSREPTYHSGATPK